MAKKETRRNKKGQFAGSSKGATNTPKVGGNSDPPPLPKRKQPSGHTSTVITSEFLSSAHRHMSELIVERKIGGADPAVYLRELAQRKGRISGAMDDTRSGLAGNRDAQRRTVARFGPVDWNR